MTEKNPDISKAMSSNFASQCGFCSPGMATKIYQKAIRNKKKALKIKGSKDYSDEDYEAEETIKDNLCRCTGYRPILQACKDACQKYETCVDIEDIGNFIEILFEIHIYESYNMVRTWGTQAGAQLLWLVIPPFAIGWVGAFF